MKLKCKKKNLARLIVYLRYFGRILTVYAKSFVLFIDKKRDMILSRFWAIGTSFEVFIYPIRDVGMCEVNDTGE